MVSWIPQAIAAGFIRIASFVLLFVCFIVFAYHPPDGAIFAAPGQSKIEGISTYEDLIDAATELTVFFRDGHTNIEVPYSPVDFCVPLRCGWDGRGGLSFCAPNRYLRLVSLKT